MKYAYKFTRIIIELLITLNIIIFAMNSGYEAAVVKQGTIASIIKDFISADDLAFIQITDVDNIKDGEIIAYKTSDGYKFSAKNVEDKNFIPEGEIIGKVNQKIPFVGKLIFTEYFEKAFVNEKTSETETEAQTD